MQNIEMLFTQMPIPPSINRMYRNIRFPTNGTTGRVSTQELKHFKKQMEHYYWLNTKQFAIARQTLKDIKLKVTSSFYLLEKTIYTKDNRPKQMDVTNLIKALHDSLCELLLIDDKWIFESTERKLLSQNGKEYVDVHILKMD